MRTAQKAQIDLLRDDVALFARKLLGVELWPHQIEAVRSPKPFRVVCAARQTGKSYLLATVAIHTAFTRPGSTSLILSATEGAALRMFGDVRRMLEDAKLLAGSLTESNKTRLTLTNGAQIISLPSSERQVRGYTVDGVLILDEAAFMDENLWRAALYTVAAVRRPTVYLASSPFGAATHFFRRLWMEGQDPANPDYAAFHWTYKVSPIINHALLEREKERTDPLTYKAEVLGEWVDDVDSYFAYDEIMNATADYPLLPPEEARGQNVTAGVDYGMRYDSNTLVLVGALEDWGLNSDRRHPVFIVPWLEEHQAGTTDYATFVRRVAGTSIQLRGRRKTNGYRYLTLVTETNGVGAMPSQELARLMGAAVAEEQYLAGGGWEAVLPITTTASHKREAYGRLKLLLQQGRLILPRHPRLMKQLVHLQYRINPGGSVAIEAANPAVHDDLADSLAQAAWATKPYEGLRHPWQKRSFTVADRRRPEFEEVTTPGGTRFVVPIHLGLTIGRHWAYSDR